MENKSHALAAGAFVLVVTALLVAMAMWLMSDKGVTKPFELTTRDTVTGLQPQAETLSHLRWITTVIM